MVKKRLVFQPKIAVPDLEDNRSASARDIWLATWGVVAIFVIVVLVLFFTGNIGGITGAGTTLIPEQNACLRGNAITDLKHANELISAGAVCERGLLPYIKCCWWP
jgi:hypothetical protein